MCEGQLSFFSRSNVCDKCKPSFSEWSELMANRSPLVGFSDNNLSRLQAFGRTPLIKLYTKLYDDLVYDRELNDEEIGFLERVQTSFGLSKLDVDYDARILPYLYVSELRKGNQLPIPKLDIDVPVVWKQGEYPHYAAHSVLKEQRVVNLGYAGGSHGVSIRIVKGVYYRVGAHRGHAIKEEQLVKTSAGALIVTNQRLLLIPSSGNKPASIPLKKIHFYRCSQNALEVYKEGREKGFFFIMESAAVEIFGICLGALLEQNKMEKLR